MNIYRRLAAVLLTLWLLTGFVGCIAVSREVRREATPAGFTSVTPGGQWEFDQEWQCTGSQLFDLDRERRAFDRSREDWLDLGWELTDISVVLLPATTGDAERICLVGNYRRWVAVDS